MHPILPVDLCTVDQPQVHFVHQSGGLQSVTGPLPRHVALRHSMQLLIHQRGEFFQSLLVSSSLGPEQLGDVVGRRRLHPSLHSLSILYTPTAMRPTPQ